MVVGHVAQDAEQAEGDLVTAQALAPLEPGAAGEDRIEQLGQLRRMRAPALLGLEARIVHQVGALHRLAELGPQFVLAHDGELDPAAVGGAVLIGERAARLGARWPRRDEGAEQGALRQDGVRPQAAGMQGRGDFAAFAGAFPVQQSHGDGGEQVHAGHLVALRRQGEGRRTAFVGQAIEQSGPCKKSRRIEARLFGIGAALAVARHRGIDQPRIDVLHVGIAHAQTFTHLERKVHHHDVGGGQQPVEGDATLGMLEIEHHRSLVAIDQVPTEIDRMLGHRMGLPQLALRVAFAGRFDLDDLRAVIPHHRCGYRARDETRQIEYAETLQRQLTAH